MSDRLPPMSPEDREAFATLERHDHATLNIGTIARTEFSRSTGTVTATVWVLTPELRDLPVTISGDFPDYLAAFLALSDSLDDAAHHALAALPRH